MNKNKGSILAGVAVAVGVLALLVGFVAYNKTPSQIVGSQGQQGIQGPKGADGKDGITKVVTQVVEKPVSNGGPILGAVSTLSNVDSPYVGINGAKSEYYGLALSPGTSTPCVIKSPPYRTSLSETGLRVSVPLVGAGSSAITWTLATSTAPNATTTPYQGFVTTESSSPIYLVIATSTVATQTLTNIAANTYITWSLTGTTTTTGTTYLRGSCYAQFVNAL